MEEKISLMPTIAIHTASPFKDLFPIKESVLNEIAEDMKQNGFDFAHPIIIWAGHKVTVVDGHTRLAAAQKIHLNKKEFASEDEALQYAIKAQSHRRSLTPQELLNCLAELDKRKSAGRPGKLATFVANFGKSSEATADLLGISRGKVEKLRTIKNHATAKIRNAVASGNMSIDKGYKETMKARRQDKAKELPPLTGTELQDLKESRSEAIKVSIIKMVKMRLEREVQEYPEIGYSFQERNTLRDVISSEIGNLIADMLPGENENEQ